jgi:hypothetical protein
VQHGVRGTDECAVARLKLCYAPAVPQLFQVARIRRSAIGVSEEQWNGFHTGCAASPPEVLWRGQCGGYSRGLLPGCRPIGAYRNVKWTEALREFFQAIFTEFGKPGTTFTMHRTSVEGDYAYIFWSAETADNRYEAATDTFVVRDGKIMAQSFAAKITLKH